MTEIPRVFISSTSQDLTEHRSQAREACLDLEMFPVMMENLPASAQDAISVSLGMVDKADIYVGIFAHRYGYVPEGYDISVTQMEYERAVERNMPRLVFVMDDDHAITRANVETDGQAVEKVAAFKARLLKDNIVNFFKSPADLRAQVTRSLTQHLNTPETPATGGTTVNQRMNNVQEGAQIGTIEGDVHIHYGSSAQDTESSQTGESPPSSPPATASGTAAQTVFLTYSRADGRGLGEKVEAALDDGGVTVETQYKTVPGMPQEQAIRAALDRSHALVLLLTPGTLHANDARGQWNYALEQRNITVIPVYTPGFDPDDLPLSLRNIAPIDGRLLKPQQIAAQLLVALESLG